MLKLGENALKIGSGATPRGGKSSYLDEGLFALVRSQNVHNHGFTRQGLAFISEEQAQKLANVELIANDVLINITGDSVARVCLIDPTILPARVNQHVAILRPDPDVIDPLFLRYFLVKPSSQSLLLALASAGATRNALTKSMLESLEIPSIDILVQRTIGQFLKSLDDKIDLNRRMNETLEEMARALFRDWFVDFGPTRRQMDMKDKGIATDPVAIMGGAFSAEKAATLALLFPAALDEDGLPEGWSYGKAADHIDFNPKEPLKRGTNAPYSDMASLPTSGSLIAPPAERDFKSGMRFRNGDALIARITPCLENGKAGFVDYLTNEAPVGWGSTEFFVLRSKPHVAPQFAYCLVRDPDFRKRAEQSMTGTSGRQRAQIEVLKSHELAVPDDKVHANFEEITTPFFKKIRANGKENQTLAQMRDLLLQKLMSGEIRVGGLEAAG